MINDRLPESVLPETFKVEFQLLPQTIQFNMLADDQVDLLVEIAKEWVDKIGNMVEASDKDEYHQTISYPNIGFLDPEKAIVQINIQYRSEGGYPGDRVDVVAI